jgi:hypothetical protein
LIVPNSDEERQCYEKFYDATSNKALSLRVCPVCAREKLAREGEQSFLLLDPSIIELLTCEGKESDEDNGTVILRHLLEVDERGVVSCWMCFECVRTLEHRTLPKLSLANNLSLGDVPFQLSGLTIPEQLPKCRRMRFYYMR